MLALQWVQRVHVLTRDYNIELMTLMQKCVESTSEAAHDQKDVNELINHNTKGSFELLSPCMGARWWGARYE